MLIYGKYNLDPKQKLVKESFLDMSEKLKLKNSYHDRNVLVKNNIGLCLYNSINAELLHNENNSVYLAAEGEIYNHAELKENLVKKGHTFKSFSDMEIIIHLYEEGTENFNKLDGIFSLAIWDNNKRILTLVRDKLGVKQIYYAVCKNSIIFSSDIKAILQDKEYSKTMDVNSFYDYLSFGYVPSPKTIFNNINKLPPGYLATISNAGVQTKEYWQNNFNYQNKTFSEEYYIENSLDLICKAVKRRLPNSRPWGLFLSGGLDSSSIAHTIAEMYKSQINTFSIGFKEKYYDETKYAGIVSKHYNTKHRHYILPDNPLSSYEDIIWNLGDIISESTIIPYYFLVNYTSREVDISFSGEGGDELFAGYLTHLADILIPLYKNIPDFLKKYIVSPLTQLIPDSYKPISLNYKIRDFIYGSTLPAERVHYHWREIFTEEDKKELLKNTLLEDRIFKDSFLNYKNKIAENKFKNNYGLDAALHNDLKINLADNILFFENSLNKMNSFRVRTPYLDSDLVEFAAAIPAEMKIKNFKTKYILRKAMRGKLPQKILKKSKHGLSSPDKIWIRQKKKNIILDVLSEQNTIKTKYFNPYYIKQLIKDHLNNKFDNSRKLWTIYTFLTWHKVFMK
ncbi:MAG: asparagine synthase (glutamine-hydrolyzing) [Candidatus Omnitrophota bacterium]